MPAGLRREDGKAPTNKLTEKKNTKNKTKIERRTKPKNVEDEFRTLDTIIDGFNLNTFMDDLDIS